jgi:hypothetical protein
MPITPTLNHVKSRIVRGTVLNTPYLKVPNQTLSFAVKFSPFYLFTYTTTLCLQEQSPLYNFHLKRWETRQEPLWVSFISNNDVGKKRVVKTVTEKRLRGAFINSVKKFGYAKDGTKLEKALGRFDGNNQNLVGTAQFISQPQLLKTKHEHLQKQMDAVVEQIISRQKSVGGVNDLKGLGRKPKQERIWRQPSGQGR